MKKLLFTLAVLLTLIMAVACSTPAPHTHSYGDWEIATEATCGIDGERIRKCECGEFETQKIPKLSLHDFSVWTVTTAPTCIEEGIKTGTCSSCGKTVTRSIPAKGHTKGQWEIIEPTCTENGSKSQMCTICSELISTVSILAKGHKNGEWITDLEPTCTKNGSEHQVCATCSATIDTKVIFCTGHKNGEWIVDVEATCTEDGKKHQVCAICNATLETKNISAAHNYIILQNSPTCLNNGTTTLSCAKCSSTFTEEWDPITFSFTRGHYVIDTTYYMEFTIKKIKGGVVKYDNYANKESNLYSVTIYNICSQEIKTFNLSENYGSQTLRYYTHVFDGAFMIYINDGYSTYTYRVTRGDTNPVQYSTPIEHHRWDTSDCGSSASCEYCKETRTVGHTTLAGICGKCNMQTYMPKITSEQDLPIDLGYGEITAIFYTFSPYTSKDDYVMLNITAKGWKSSTDSLLKYSIKIYDADSGMLVSSRNEWMGAEVSSGDFIKETLCRVVKCKNYRIVIARQ